MTMPLQLQAPANLFNTPANTVPSHMGQSMTILSVMMIPEAGRTPVMIHPYEVVMDYGAVGKLGEQFAQNGVLTIPSVAGTLGAGIRPNMTAATAAPIHNGWGTSRYRWVIQVQVQPHLGVPQILMLDGWTDYMDNSYGGLIDPNMRFHINSTSTISLGSQPVAQLHSVSDTSLIFRMPDKSDTRSPLMLQRASDIDAMKETASMIHNAGGLNGQFGAINSGITLSNTPMTTLSGVADADIHTHASAPRFAYDMIMAARTSHTAGELDEDYARRSMRMRLMPKSQHRNPFIAAVNRKMDNQYNCPDYASFTFQDLTELDPHLVGSNRLVIQQQIYQNVDYGNAGDYSAAAQIAAIYAQAVPAYMSIHGIQALEFLQQSNGDVIIVKCNSVLQNYDLSLLTQSLKAALQSELFVGASYNGAVPFCVSVKSRTYGYTEVTVTAPDGRQESYNYPTYASSTYAPQVTDKVDTVLNLGVAFGDLMTEISAASVGYGGF